MRAQRPQRVLVGAELPQVQPVGVDVVDVAQLARVGELLELVHARVVLEQVADHEHLAGVARGLDRPLGLRDRLGPAASRRSSACPPRAPSRPARRGWGRAWRGRPRRARDRRAPRPATSWCGRRAAGRRCAPAPPRRRRTASAARCPRRPRSCGRGSAPSSRARPPRPALARGSQSLHARGRDPPGDAAQVEHARGLADHLVERDLGMGGDDDREVGALERLVERRRAPRRRADQLGHVRVVVDEVRPALAEHPEDLQRGRLARVPDARLVGDPEDRDARSSNRLAGVVERALDLLHAVVGHLRG